MIDELNKYNFTWGEQPSGTSYSDEYQELDDILNKYKWNEVKKSLHIPSPNIFIMKNILSKDECEMFIELVSSIKYDEYNKKSQLGEMVLQYSKETDIPVIWTEPKKIRTNGRRIWQISKPASDIIFNRILNVAYSQLKEVYSDGKKYELVALNRRCRFFETLPGQEFYEHIDASSSSVLDDNTLYSFYSVVIWLNTDFTGGDFVFSDNTIATEAVSTLINEGLCLIFPQSFHDDAKRHIAKPVTSGVKYLLRTDLMYSLVMENKST